MKKQLLNFKIESFRCISDGSIMRFCDTWLSQNKEKIDKEFTIHSIKQLSDGEVFTIDDRLVNKEDSVVHSAYAIEKFIQHENQVSVKLFCHVDRHFSIDKWEKAILSFITNDGFNIYQRQEYWYITTSELSHQCWVPKIALTKMGPKINEIPLGDVQFSSEYAAEQYIQKNKTAA